MLLARALLAEPDLLLLDEPAQGLDHPGMARALPAGRRGATDRLGCGVLMVSHDLHIVMGATDRIIALNGVIWCEGPPVAVSSASEYRMLFGEAEPGALAFNRHTPEDGCSTIS